LKTFDRHTLDRLRIHLQSRPAIEIEPGRRRRACVVAPFVETTEGWALVFISRAEDLRAHSGQVSFPGGAADEGEALVDAARREMEEEVGVPAKSVELIGRLDDLITMSGYVVAPFVGIIPPNFPYVPQESEVREVFEVPVSALLDPSNPQIRYVGYQGKLYPSYFYHHRTREVWGLTGRMVKALLDAVYQVL
jgi:8-oxo-dGTP pyrophosphatase MutT (NUDIX family)